jgi:hypothetical protein
MFNPGIPEKRQLNAPCTITNAQGQIISAFVQINNVLLVSSPPREEVLDCNTMYDSINGGGAYPNKSLYCDTTPDIHIPGLPYACTNSTTTGCMNRIHTEIDHDWKAAGYCGTGTVCDNSTLHGVSKITPIDIQGFVYWDPEGLTSFSHGLSGWEIHPLTAWRVSLPPPGTFGLSPTIPVVGQPVTFNGSSTGMVSPIFTWSYGDGSTLISTSSVATHTYAAQGIFNVTLTVADTDGTTLSTSQLIIVASYRSTSWNPKTSCTPLVMTVEQVRAENTSNPGVPYHRQLAQPCVVTAARGQVYSTLIQVNWIRRGSVSENDWSTTFSTINGGGSYPNGLQSDSAFNIYNPSYSYSCSSATDPNCAHRIYTEIDHDWKGASYCGPGTVCDNSTLVKLTAAQYTVIDVQGFLHSNSPYVNTTWHSLTGWEFHPVSAWRISAFNITASPSALSVGQGSSGASTITLKSLNGFSGTVSLASSISPAGPAVSLAATSLRLAPGGSNSTTFRISPASSSPGTYFVTVNATSGSTSYVVVLAVTVTPPADFSVSASPPSVTVASGASNSSAITVTSQNGFAGNVTLTTSTAPSVGLTVSCSPSRVTLGTIASSTCTFGSSTPNVYKVNVTGTSGTLSHTVSITVTVATVDFNINANPISVTVLSNVAGNSSINITSIGGFTGSVALSTSSSTPLGLSCSLAPAVIALGASGTSKLSCSGSVGTYMVPVTGTIGSLSHSISVGFNVQDFTISASSTALTTTSGTSVNSTISIGAVNGFSGSVTLSPTMSSTSLSCGLTPAIVVGPSSSVLSCAGPVGNYSVNVTGTSGMLSHSVVIALSVTPAPDFTVAASPTSVATMINSAANSTITLTSLNQFSGTVNLTSSPSSPSLACAISPASLNLVGSATSTLSCTGSIAGSFNVIITGTAGSQAHSTTVTFTINTGPDFVISANPPNVQGLNANSTGSLTITVTGVSGFTDNVTLTMSASSGLSATPSSVLVSASGSSTLTISAATAGNYSLTITGSSGSLSHSLILSVTIVDFIISASPTTVGPVVPGGSASSSVTIAPVEGFANNVTLTVYPSQGLTATLNTNSVQGPGTIQLTVSPVATGTYTVTVVGTSGSMSHSVLLTITANQPPALTVPAMQTVNETSLLSFTVNASDLDFGENVALSATGLPAGSTFSAVIGNPASGNFSWTPSEAQGPGDYTIIFVAADGFFTVTGTLTIHVNEVNLPPVLSVPGPQVVNELTTLNFSVSATDPDIPANIITLSASGLPAGSTFDSSTGQFSWTPSEAQGPGDYNITFVATDNGSPSLSDTKTVSIHVNEVNTPPTLAVPGPKTIAVGSTLTFSVNSTDTDIPLNTITLSMSGLVSGMSFSTSAGNPTTGTLAFTPTASESGMSFTLTFNATDNGSPPLSTTKTVTVTVVKPYALVVSSDGKVWRYQDGNLTLIGQPTTKALYQVAWRPGGSYALMVGDGATLIKYNGTTFTTISTGVAGSVNFQTVAWRPDGSYALIAGTSGVVVKYDGLLSTQVKDLTKNTIRSISWQPNGLQALLAGSKGTLLTYQNGTLQFVPSGTSSDLYAVAWNPNGLYAMVAGANGVILRYDGIHVLQVNTTGVYSSSLIVRAIAWNPSGNLALLSGDSGLVLTYDGTSLAMIPKITSNTLYSISWWGSSATIVGGSGTILKYSGSSLTKQASNTTSSLRGIIWKPF